LERRRRVKKQKTSLRIWKGRRGAFLPYVASWPGHGHSARLGLQQLGALVLVTRVLLSLDPVGEEVLVLAAEPELEGVNELPDLSWGHSEFDFTADVWSLNVEERSHLFRCR